MKRCGEDGEEVTLLQQGVVTASRKIFPLYEQSKFGGTEAKSRVEKEDFAPLEERKCQKEESSTITTYPCLIIAW